MPNGVHRVRVMAVGGGAGGGSGPGGVGGSGYVVVSDVQVNPFDVVPVTVGLGGAGSSYKYNDNVQTAAAGQASLFGSLLRANGGQIGITGGLAALAALAAAGIKMVIGLPAGPGAITVRQVLRVILVEETDRARSLLFSLYSGSPHSLPELEAVEQILTAITAVVAAEAVCS